MAAVRIYHNPRCSTSRNTLALLRDRGVEPEIVEYLKEPLDEPTLRRVLAAIDDPPDALVRKDKRFGELGLDADDYRTADAVVALLLEHPELMQRPIVVVGPRVVIARPIERVLDVVG